MFNPITIRSIQDYIKEFKKYRLQIIINFEKLSFLDQKFMKIMKQNLCFQMTRD